VIAGVPNVLAASDFTVTVTSSDGQSASVDLEIGVFNSMQVSTASLPTGIAGTPYDATLAAAGGDGAFTWAVVGGSLPPGITLNGSTGRISGTPTTTSAALITFEASSGDGQTEAVQLQLTIYGMLTVTTATLANAVQSAAYAAAVDVSGGGMGLSWSISAGSLPADLSLNTATGVISGTPSAIESTTFTVEVVSGDGQVADAEFTISVYAPLVVTSSVLATGEVGEAYSTTLQASGGDGSYTWSMDGLSLLPNLSFDGASGTLSGTPDDWIFLETSAEVSSGDGQTASALVYIYIYAYVLETNDLCSDYPATSRATFASPELEAAVRAQVGSRVWPEYPLTCQTVAGVLSLDARGLGISDISGIQNLTGALYVYLRNNAITDLSPLSGLPAIEQLFIAENPLSGLSPLSSLTTLTVLGAEDSGLTDITGVEGLVGLDRLFLQDNSIDDLTPLSGLTNLDFLWLGANALTDIGPLSTLTGLTTLDVQYNLGITDIQPLLDNVGIGDGDDVNLNYTSAPCADVDALRAKGVTVHSPCPPVP